MGPGCDVLGRRNKRSVNATRLMSNEKKNNNRKTRWKHYERRLENKDTWGQLEHSIKNVALKRFWCYGCWDAVGEVIRPERRLKRAPRARTACGKPGRQPTVTEVRNRKKIEIIAL